MNLIKLVPAEYCQRRPQSYHRFMPKRSQLVIGLFITAVLFLSLHAAQAQDNAEDQVPLPKAFGEPRSVRVAPALGVVSDRIPIVVSPGRRNVEPQLALTYSSMAGHGDVGMGWQLEIGQVERWRGDGTPTVGDPNAYSYALAGLGGELHDVGEGVYRARMESVYREFHWLPDLDPNFTAGWEMSNGEGILHRFGTTAESRIDGQVWMLDLVQDPSGNTIHYFYETVDGVLYPMEIRYTGFAATGDLGANRIVFEYEPRPDVRVSYDYGARQVRGRRLSRVSVFAGESLTRRYEFAYEQSSVNNESLLSSVTLVGADDESRITLRTLEYSSRSLVEWKYANGIVPLDFADSEGRDTGARVSDVDGDGRADIVGNGSGVWLGTGSGHFNADALWSQSLASIGMVFVVPGGDYQGADTGVRLTDVNADGLPDILIASPSWREVWLNTGKGWSNQSSEAQEWTASLNTIQGRAEVWIDPYYLNDPNEQEQHDLDYCLLWDQEVFALAENDGDSKGVQLTDVNGDGRVDIVWSMMRTDRLYFGFGLGRIPVYLRGVFLNTGAGWEKSEELTDALWSVGDFVIDSQLQGYDVMDVNGDGIADIVRTLAGETREVLLGTGDGWEYDADYSASLAASHIFSLNGDREGQGLMPVDFDDDGLLDYFRANGTVTYAYHNTGRGWEESSQLASWLARRGVKFNTDDGKGTGVVLTDMDGDGISDIIMSKNGVYTHWVTSSLRAGLLTRSISALGEVAEIDWTSSCRFNNRRPDGVQGLPSPMTVAESIMRDDGRGNAYTTSFYYEGGLFEDRQFRGFRSCVQTRPGDLTIEAYYHQEAGLAGQLDLEEVKDAQGQVRIRRSSVYEIVQAAAMVEQLRLIQTDTEMIDPEGTRHTRVETTYDDRLNTVSVRRDPEVSIADDETLTVFSWALNEAAGIWSLPARIQTFGPDGALMTESIMLYDGLEEGQANRGLPTEAHDLVQPGTYVTKSMEYDQYGNIIRAYDRTGSMTEFEYGDSTATFRTRAVDPEGRIVTSAYDRRFGELVLDVDASGNGTVKSYDAFGRLVRVCLPGDEQSPFGTQTYTYSPLGDAEEQYYRVAETETPGKPDTLDTTRYFDGMGLVYRVERDGPDGRRIITLSDYDDEGNPIANSRPFFEGDQPLTSLIERDELHRPVRLVEPDGTALHLSYAGARADLVDHRGFKTSFVRDTDGQITATHQWVDGVEQITNYLYDALGRLVAVVDALGSETRISYDCLGQRVSFEDSSAGLYGYRYDGEGRLVEQTAPGGQVTHYFYNSAGDLLRKEFPDGTTNEFVYGTLGDGNGVGRVVHIKDAAGTVDIRYDGRGNVIERRRTVLGQTYVTGYTYDSLDRLRHVTYPDGFTVSYEYDAGGNLVKATDGQGRILAEGKDYNAASQVGRINFENGVQSRFSYDELLRMTSIRTFMAANVMLQSLRYGYDTDGNVLSIADDALGASQQFEYDALGRLTQAIGPYGKEVYKYDAIGNLLQKGNLIFNIDPTHPQRVINGAYLDQSGGKPKKITNTSDTDSLVTNSQDASVVEQGQDSSGAHSTGSEQGKKAKAKDSKKSSSDSVGAQEPLVAQESSTEQDVTSSRKVAHTFHLDYDERGNVIAKGDRRFEYDAENHLVRVRNSVGKIIEENVYDASGQRVIQRTPQQTTIFIDGIYEHGKTHASRHVRMGPLLVATVVTPRTRVRLIDEVPQVTLGQARGEGGGSSWSWIFIVPVCVVGAFLGIGSFRQGKWWRRGLTELGEIGGAVRSKPWKSVVILLMLVSILNNWGPYPLFGADALRPSPKSEPPSEKRYYYHSNHLGSVNIVTNEKGKIVEQRNYKPYGDPFDWTGPNSGPRELLLTFDGHRYDDDTGLYYFGARHYDAELGRFLTADTQVPDPMNPKSLHRYAFAGGNPIRYHDPTGHAWYDFLIAAFVFLAAIVLTVVTFGALAGVGVALIALGAGLIAAAVALSQGLSPLSVEFWEQVVAGVVLGAVIGAGLFALPTMLSSSALWIENIAAMALVGAATGAIETTISHFASGGGPEGLFGTSLFTSILIGGAIGAVAGAAGGWINPAIRGIKSVSVFAKAGKALLQGVKMVKNIVGYSLTAVRLGYAGIASALEGSRASFMNDVVFPNLGDLLSYRASPRKPIGIPAWAVAGSWPGVGGGSGQNTQSALFQTMPLAP